MEGAAIATLSVRVAEFLIVMIYAAVQNKKWFHLKLSYLVRADGRPAARIFRYSTPVLLGETCWGVGISMQAAVIGNLGNSASAAANIVGVVQKLTTVLIFGVCDADDGHRRQAHRRGKRGGGQGGRLHPGAAERLLGVFSAALALLIGNGAMSAGLFDMENQTAEYVHIMLYGTAAFVFLQSFNATTIVGIMRGGGDTRAAFLMDALTMWLISLPVGLLAGYVFHIPAPFVQILMISDEFVKFFICIWRFKSMKWLTNVTQIGLFCIIPKISLTKIR